MRHTTTVAAAVLLLTLTACSTEADAPPASSSPKASAPAATEKPADKPAADDEEAALEKAVRAYSAAYFATDAAKAHSLMSKRCRDEAPIELYRPMVEATVATYGKHEIKTVAVDQLSGDMARVTYTYPVPTLTMKQQPWVREGGQWRNDHC
jgi:hypothetical protein